MATRSRTLLFLQYRNSFSRTTSRRPAPSTATGGRHTDTSEKAGLIANEVDHDAEVVVEMSVLPPKWIDVVDEVDEDVDRIRARITELDALHKKHLLPGFDDQMSDEQSIDRLTTAITDMFRDCERKVKRIALESNNDTFGGAGRQNQALARNIQTSLATKLQELSGSFRKSQSNYLQKLRGREIRSKDALGNLEAPPTESDDDLDAVFTDAQLATVQNNERAITEREREINEIVKSMLGVADIFKELHTMVIDQGTVLDRIDYNVEMAGVHVEEAHKELLRAQKYQDNTKAKYFIIFLAIVVFFLFLVLIFKSRGSSSTATRR
ncbi:t-SNARE [Fimicolochytrium jonesii]|uniref:t-SNARE n=1 Tax=Fimicolochytrium jonesii TaxID=1396493 RepID=UPI0022FEAEE0|nr:t-SNARE [Fimicolochytrium jonesii]KAI8823970.1 t-SNARE [Fimicolochytrium jonesii]